MSSKKVRLPRGFWRRGEEVCCKVMIAGRRVTIYGKSVQECRDKETQKRREAEERIYARGKGLTVKAFGETWLESKRGTVKETTLRTEGILLRLATETVLSDGRRFGELRIREVETGQIRELQGEISRRKTTRTTNDTVSLIKGLFQAAMTERILSWNPVGAVKGLRRVEPPARETKHRALTREETRAFLEAAEGSYYFHLFVLLLNTGLRLGEAGALFSRDITQKGIQVARTITRTEIGGYEVGEDTKTAAGRRLVPLNEAARQAIEREREKRGIVEERNGPIFVGTRGGLLKAATVNADIRRICSRASIEPFTAHAFRDTFATRCVESGMQVKVLQEIMGHTDIKMTLGLYAHAMDDDKQTQLEKVNFGA